MSSWLVLIFIAIVILCGLFGRLNCYESFNLGVKDGIKTVISIFPLMITFLFAISIFNSSGILNFLKNYVNSGFGNIFIQMLVRPFSSSSSLTIMLDVYNQYGVDSNLGLISTFIHYGADSSIYMISFYGVYLEKRELKKTILNGIMVNVLAYILGIIIVLSFF